jgi:hypothetical protein
MLQSIEAWLNSGRDYQAGCHLYEQYGQDAFFKILFASRISIFNRRKLEAELEKIYEAEKAVQQKPKKFKPHLSQEKYLNLPDQIRALNEERSVKYQEMSDLHSKLVLLNAEERGKAAFKILELDQRLIKIWSMLDHHAETGELPDEGPPPAKTYSMQDAIKRIQSLKTYISRSPDSLKMELWKNEIVSLQKHIDDMNYALKIVNA